MEIRDLLKQNIQLALKELGVDLNLNEIVVENSKDPTHGDYATNVAMKSARLFGKAPRDVATMLVDKINKYQNKISRKYHILNNTLNNHHIIIRNNLNNHHIISINHLINLILNKIISFPIIQIKITHQI